MLKRFVFFLFPLLLVQHLSAQSVLTQVGTYFYSFDMTNCTYCPIMPLTPILYDCDFTILPNGNIFAARIIPGQLLVYIYEPPSTNPIQTFAISTNTTPDLLYLYDVVVASDGTMYVSGTNGLYTFDYNTGVLTFVGSWPEAYPFIMTELILITIYGKDPFIEKNNPDIKKLYELGRIAA